jgi:hypothetical protein
MLDSDLDQISEFFKNLKFEIEPIGNDGLFAVGVDGLKVTAVLSGEGVIFIALFDLPAAESSNRKAVLEFVNSANSLTAVARYTAHEKTMSVSAWLPIDVSRDSLQEFWKMFLADIEVPKTKSEFVRDVFKILE